MPHKKYLTAGRSFILKEDFSKNDYSFDNKRAFVLDGGFRIVVWPDDDPRLILGVGMRHSRHKIFPRPASVTMILKTAFM